MDEFCGSKFWDWDLTWYTDDPDLTQCFQQTILVWIPAGFLWLFGICICIFATRSRSSIPWSAFSILKITLCALLILLQTAKLMNEVGLEVQRFAVYSLDFYTPILEILTYALALVAIMFCKTFGIRSSSVLFVFWLLKTVCGAVPFRTELRKYPSIDNRTDLTAFIVEMISYPLVVAEFLLNCWADAASESQPTPKDVKKVCPESRSSTLSRLFFSWFDGFAWNGYKKPLETTDLWNLDPDNTTAALVKTFDENWSAKVKKAQQNAKAGKKAAPVSVLSVLLASFGTKFYFGSALKLVPDLMEFAAPQILNLIILFVNGNEEPWKGFFYAALLFLSDFIVSLGRNHHFMSMFMTAYRVKSALMSAVYRKALVLSNATRRERTVGEIVNLMSVDVNKFLGVIPHVNVLWGCPLRIGIALYFLWDILGPSVLAGLAVMLLLIPINSYLSSRLNTFQSAQMMNKDERVKVMSEVLSGIKVGISLKEGMILKLYAWEPSFIDEVTRIRDEELKTLRSIAHITAFIDFLWSCTQFLVTLATFATFVFVDEKNVLDSRTAFVALAVFNLMNMPLTMFPMTIDMTVQAVVSLRRLNNFMNSEEIDFGAVTHDPTEVDPIVIENGSFAWDSDAGTNVLENVNLRVKKGSLVAIVGTIGSGKSSLLSAILGEMEITSGRVNTVGNVSYASQLPWIQNATLRENILFGKQYRPERYDEVIEACCLTPDLDMFVGRDKIEIGEKGINLSGGQRQRVSVARAVYNRAGIYLFDDPLSAVDAHVGKDMFDHVFGPKGLLRKKTRLLVTHSVTFLPQVDQIVVMKNGRISEIGTYQELLDRQGAFSEFAAQYAQSESAEADGATELVPETRKQRLNSTVSDWSEVSTDDGGANGRKMSQVTSEASKDIPEAQKLIGDEFKETTAVPMRLYLDYFKTAGWPTVIVALTAYVLFQVFALAASFWLSAWSETEVVNGTQPNQGYNVGVYAGLGFLQSVTFVTASITMCLACLSAASRCHSNMLGRILRAPMWFFDTTPVGRILNRFGKDVDVLDNKLSMVVRDCCKIIINMIGGLVLIIYNLPIFAAVLVPLSILYYLAQKLSIPTSRQLKRLESVTQSPIYSNFGESINGASTIRAYGQQNRFLLEAQARIDSNQACYFPSIVSARWLATRLEFIGTLSVFFTATFVVLSPDTIGPGAVGLSISVALRITFGLGFLVRTLCEIEGDIVAVERLREYFEAPQEAAWESVRKPPRTWPQSGAVKFVDYETRYREGLDLVLRNVSFDIQAGEKVGVVGRTGAGKSSLTLALFRLIEGTGGSIVIDGENISNLGLHDLRGRLTIIPQDPVLFSGTLRFNLDPFLKHTDYDIWRALELAHLSQFVNSLPTKLGHTVADGGDNLSVGQKQLVCLARALLRKSKILVLDEATAAIDLETDDLIQETIRTEFQDSTVITIAHRINTIMDSTKILVLDNGHVREYETPEKLLQDSSSLFYQMAKDAGLVPS